MSDLAAVQAIVYGLVQGVYFRAFTSRKANELGVTGYVRNTWEGTVEVHAEGERQQLRQLIDHLGIGPSGARVEKVVTNWSEYTGNYSGFGVRY